MRTTDVRDEMRNALLDAAGRLLVRYGYRKTTVDDIAQEAGVGKGTIYLHFRSKEDLALSFLDRASQDLDAHLRAMAQGPGSAPEKIEAILVKRILYWFECAQEYTQSLDEVYAALRAQLLARREEYHDCEAEILAGVIRDGCAAGTFYCDDPLATANAMMIATNALLPFNLTTEQLGRRADMEARGRTIADLLIHGLGRKERPKA